MTPFSATFHILKLVVKRTNKLCCVIFLFNLSPFIALLYRCFSVRYTLSLRYSSFYELHTPCVFYERNNNIRCKSTISLPLNFSGVSESSRFHFMCANRDKNYFFKEYQRLEYSFHWYLEYLNMPFRSKRKLGLSFILITFIFRVIILNGDIVMILFYSILLLLPAASNWQRTLLAI